MPADEKTQFLKTVSLAAALALSFYWPAYGASTVSGGLTVAPAVPQTNPNDSFGPGFEKAVGVAAAVTGEASLTGTGSPKPLRSGMPVYLDQTITTGASGHVQLLLRDETVFTVGSNSSLTIDRFVFNPDDSGKITARVGKGVFRFVSGRVAKKKPENVDIQMPVGSIGIRGTIVAGRASDEGATVMLLGPGDRNNAGSRGGRMSVENAGQEVTVSRNGYGTRIEGAGGAPQEPFQVSQEELLGLVGDLQPKAEESADSGENGEGSATSQAEEDTFGAGEDSESIGSLSELEGELDELGDNAAQDDLTDDAAQEFDSDLASYADLRRVAGGNYTFQQTGVPLIKNNAVVGNYDLVYIIDFTNDIAGITGSKVTISGVDFTVANPINYSALDGLAQFDHPNLNHNVCAMCDADLRIFAVMNDGDDIATSVAHIVQFDDGQGNQSAGFGLADRQ